MDDLKEYKGKRVIAVIMMPLELSTLIAVTRAFCEPYEKRGIKSPEAIGAGDRFYIVDNSTTP